MGWSIDMYKGDLDAIFSGLKKQYSIQHVEATNPTVRILHEGEVPFNVMKTIVGLFPEMVYVNFVPNCSFPLGSSIAGTH